MMTWDTALLCFLNRALACPFLDLLMVGLTVLVRPAVLVVALLPLLRRRRREAVALLGVVVVAALAAVGLQFLFCRPRPAGVRLLLPTPAFPSFPSGHAAVTFGCALLVALFWRRASPAAFLAALLVSASRVYLGHHYPSDVLAGAIVGMAVALLVYGLGYMRQGARPRWAWLLWGQLALVLLATLGAYLGLLDLAPLALPGADKVLHFILFGALAFFSVGWWADRPAGWVLGALALLVVLEEVLQALSPARSLDGLDLTASLAGVVVLGALAAHARRSHPNGSARPAPP